MFGQHKTRKIFKIIGSALVALIVLFITFTSGAYFSQKNRVVNAFTQSVTQRGLTYLADVTGQYNNDTDGLTASNTDFSLYWTLWDTLRANYVDPGKINDNDLFYGSLKGMVSSLGDPYTVFFDPKTNKDFENDLAGTFDGIGAEIGLRNDVITVISPLDGMPAAKAGILAGDQILAVNGTSTNGLAVDVVVQMIRGPKGTPVTLSVYRKGLEKAKDYKITRDTIVVKSVKTEMRKDGLYVIRVSAFNDDTRDLFEQAVKDVLAKKPKGLILDLRNNPGGYLDTAVAMASEWITSGPVVIEKFNDTRQNAYPSNGLARLKDIKTAVLINGGSASASEIVSGALRDYKKAALIGEKTFGKGSVQSLINFSDGSALKVTIAKWLTPNGDSINDLGINPTQEVKLTIDDFNKNKDPQMDAAVKFLLTKTPAKAKVTVKK
jgi:carboxyl-terminal processing protease